MAHIVLSVLMVTLAAATGWAEIYFWTDPSGIKHFSNVQAPHQHLEICVLHVIIPKKLVAANPSFQHLDTLAAAYAEAEKFKDAIQIQKTMARQIELSKNQKLSIPREPYVAK